MGEAKRRRLAQQTGRQTKRIRDLSGEWVRRLDHEPAQRIFERHLQIEATSANDPSIAAAVPCRPAMLRQRQAHMPEAVLSV
jgi:hypothetical protein